jgi:predicted lipoprotein with Yx(FWY)xxD motif
MKHRLASFAAAAALVALVLPGIVAAADTQVVAGKVIGTHGTLLVASSNQMTVYTFDKDVAASGVSNCTGACLANWPALTVTAGDTPTGAAGVTGTLGTITRTDNGALQATYNGKPLYFFAKDTAPGDANGIYPGWQAVVLAAAVASATPAPTATPQAATPPAATPHAATPHAATPPPTSTAPTGNGPTPSGDQVPALLFAGIAVLGFVVAARRLAAIRA